LKPAPLEIPRTRGSVTLPTEAGHEDEARALFEKWGADAIRDSDGTTLSPALLAMGHRVYSTICLVRADQECARRHPDMLPMKFLMSEPVAAQSTSLTIDPLAGFHREKYAVAVEPKALAYWEVIDRSTGEVHEPPRWHYDPISNLVTVKDAAPFHVYTVSFLARVIWDTTSMYNHLVNKWDRPHVVSVDPYHEAVWDELMEFYDRWLGERPDTDVVRLTTLAYHFNLDVNEDGSDKFRDWVGCQETLSIEALEDFEAEYGYRPRAEDFVDEGYYNAVSRVPSKRYLDWMAFIHRFVVRFGKALVDRAHAASRKTAMFWGDHWAGVEPYSPHFQEIGIDIHVGACADGVALRRVADAPGRQVKELRLYPYFFPDVFREGGDPLGESVSNWVKIRRALMRKPVDRIGYGGYLSLVKDFPEFTEHAASICDEFRAFKEMSRGTESSKAPVRVAVLNAWGKLRSWINNFGSPQKFLIKRPDVIQVAGTNLLECLAGLPVEVVFVNFDDIRSGVPDDIDVIINDGDAGTAWSGGRHWADPSVAASVRAFVHRGGGFIGCRGPTAHPHGGRCFQLSDVLGVDREAGEGVQFAPLRPEGEPSHFITEDLSKADFGCTESFVYVCRPSARLLAESGGHVMLAANEFGNGRSVFMAGLPYSLENARLLHRAVLWSARREDDLRKWFSTNVNMDCACYPEAGVFVVVNNVDRSETTTLYDGDAKSMDITLGPLESRWYGTGA
jgi:1,3-beta-galactosyl-N-acetylhexosamine phosphorylase